MNMQAMLKQAQNLQKEMLKSKEEIDKKEFIGENGLVKITMRGNKEIINVEINKEDSLNKDDIEMLEDMIMIAANEAMNKIDNETEAKMGKYTKGIPGLF